MNNIPYILMLEDDSDDRHITESYFIERGFNVGLRFLVNSDEVLPYLEHCMDSDTPLPHLIILDKSVPARGGMRVLEELKAHSSFYMIPVVMISGTAFESDVIESYRLGANSFIMKPTRHESTAKTIETFVNYWFNVVELPNLKTAVNC